MLPLIETIIGFIVIMAILSLLAKSLSSVFKNHFDYYSKNLKGEVMSLIKGTINKSFSELQSNPALKDIQWKRLGDKYLTRDNMAWLLTKLWAKKEDLENLEGRVEVHLSNVQYAFEKRTKNIALALGLALCLGMNINAITIWNTLYHNEEVRAKFSSQEQVNAALTQMDKYNEKIEGESNIENKQELEKERDALKKQIAHFRGEVSFGFGRIWSEDKIDHTIFFYEFFGSLLTGILISIGAPYWHDLLRTIASLRKK